MGWEQISQNHNPVVGYNHCTFMDLSMYYTGFYSIFILTYNLSFKGVGKNFVMAFTSINEYPRN